METELEKIETNIIEQLNIADDNLTKEEFDTLAESIISYIDEIGRSK